MAVWGSGEWRGAGGSSSVLDSEDTVSFIEMSDDAEHVLGRLVDDEAENCYCGRGQAKECPICWEPMEGGRSLFTTECGHMFHFSCLQVNYQGGNVACPLCRSAFYEPPVILQDRTMSPEWFFADITREEAEDLLNGDGTDGCYLVRESRSTPGQYCLSIRHSQNWHCRIFTNEKGEYYLTTARTFKTIADLIHFYTTSCSLHSSGGFYVKLARPVTRSGRWALPSGPLSQGPPPNPPSPPRPPVPRPRPRPPSAGPSSSSPPPGIVSAPLWPAAPMASPPLPPSVSAGLAAQPSPDPVLVPRHVPSPPPVVPPTAPPMPSSPPPRPPVVHDTPPASHVQSAAPRALATRHTVGAVAGALGGAGSALEGALGDGLPGATAGGWGPAWDGQGLYAGMRSPPAPGPGLAGALYSNHTGPEGSYAAFEEQHVYEDGLYRQQPPRHWAAPTRPPPLPVAMPPPPPVPPQAPVPPPAAPSSPPTQPPAAIGSGLAGYQVLGRSGLVSFADHMRTAGSMGPPPPPNGLGPPSPMDSSGRHNSFPVSVAQQQAGGRPPPERRGLGARLGSLFGSSSPQKPPDTMAPPAAQNSKDTRPQKKGMLGGVFGGRKKSTPH